jgi:hypothetical protein
MIIVASCNRMKPQLFFMYFRGDKRMVGILEAKFQLQLEAIGVGAEGFTMSESVNVVNLKDVEDVADADY